MSQISKDKEYELFRVKSELIELTHSHNITLVAIRWMTKHINEMNTGQSSLEAPMIESLEGIKQKLIDEFNEANFLPRYWELDQQYKELCEELGYTYIEYALEK